MAKAPTTTATTSAPRVFSFDDFGQTDTLPEIDRPQRSTELPFKALFDKMLPVALAGKKHAYRDIPQAYFTDERGITFNDTNKRPSAYIKDKIRGVFNDWKKAEPHNGNPGVSLVMVWRDGTQEAHVPQGGTTPEPYLTIFLTKA